MKSSGFRYVALILGLLLLVTCILKTHAAFTDRPVETSFLTSRWSVLTIAEFELFLGAWLLAGFRPAVAQGCALASFTCFLGISLFSSLAGERSCSCFGNLTVSPWFALTIDVGAVSALLLWKPRPDASSTALCPLKCTFLVLIIGSLLAIPFALAISSGSSRPLLIPSEQVVDLGVLSWGSRQSAILWLANKGAIPVEVETVESSCHCLTLECSPRVVPPSESTRTIVTLDLEKEPAFVGTLRIHVQGKTRSGALAFSVQVRARVREP